MGLLSLSRSQSNGGWELRPQLAHLLIPRLRKYNLRNDKVEGTVGILINIG